jgi:hypothetical protein
MAEGVGFEPTVGFPTLDFESSALNRTQPPFLNGRRNFERPTSNIQPRMQLCPTLGVRRWTFHLSGEILPLFSVQRWGLRGRHALCASLAKNVTIFNLPCPWPGLHIVCPTGQPRYYLLLTGIHRLLAPLFTSIRILFGTLTLPHRHDSTKTRNSARFT